MESLKLAEQALVALDLKYTRQILAALLPMCLTVAFHGFGISLVQRFFRRFGKAALHGPRYLRTLVTIAIVGILLVTHFFGITVWAAFYVVSGLLSDYGHAMYYSMNAYTTMGASDIRLPHGWLGFGNFEAMTGMLMFGWSTAVLADLVQKLHSIEG